ncbi:MAG: hypothetical protein M3N08_08155 [Pseudomonadota bacterium]|nr:hypothetical protein [Pseudomonadota bacterium]
MEELSLTDYLAILKRQKKYFLLTFSVLMACSFVFALFWSNYRSTATVEIEQPEIATDMTTPIGMNPSEMSGALADLHVSKIEQKVTAPGSLVEIITKFNLYSNARKFTPVAALAATMRDKIKLDLVSSTVANPAAAAKVSADQLSAIAFTLSFDYSDPQMAQQVTNEIVTRFLDEDLKERRAQAQETSAFLASQITALESAMAQQEKKIADFQTAHGVSRPEALMFNQQAAATASMNIQALDSQIASNEGTQGTLRAQLATVDPYSRVIADGQVMTTPAIQLKALQAQYSTLSAQYGPSHPDVVKVRHQMESLRAEVGRDKQGTGNLKSQIEDIRTNLAGAEQTKGAENPDVISLRNQLKKLQSQLAAQGGDRGSDNGLKNDADNPAYLQLVAQLRSAEEQHKSMLAQREALQRQQAKYQEAVATNPALEQQMAILSRDYDNSQLRYRELKEKKMAADMDEQMVQDRKGQRLVVISPPDLPLKTHPSRLMIVLAGLMLSLMGGIGSVVLAQAISQSVLGSQHLSSLVGVAPLVSIPHIYTADELQRAQRRKPLMVATVVVTLIAAAAAFNFMVMPFDVLWSVASQHLGVG